MKASEMRSKTEAELQTQLLDLLKQQFQFRMQAKSGQMADTSQIKKARRDVARIKTTLKQKAGQSA